MSFWDKVKLTTGPDRNINNLKQPVNNISEMENPNDFKQTEMVNNDTPMPNPTTLNEGGTLQAVDDANRLFMGHGYDDIGEFMGNLAATESNLGSQTLGDYSFSPFQIDPIRYRDIVERAGEGGAAGDRARIANEYLRKELNDPNFDILNLFDAETEPTSDTTSVEKYIPNEMLQSHNPLVGAMLTRMGLANVKEGIPENIFDQADYWKKHWNVSGAGDSQKFIDQSQHHFPGNYVTKPLSDQAF